MYKNILLLLLIMGLLSSCFKKDEIVIPHDPGEVTTTVIPMTKYYNDQYYFKLDNNEIVSSNNRSIFDLNFSCNDTLTDISLNTANFAMAAETDFEKLEDVTDTIGLKWNFDKSDGNPDSLAIKHWVSIAAGDTTYSNRVWVINRGISALGIQLGLKKVKFQELKGNKYYFSFSNMDNSGLVETFVEKDDVFGSIQYSFQDETEMQTEPEIDNWDLLFTTYSTLLFTNEGSAYPYLVTGVLQNQKHSMISLDTSLVFSEISLSDTSLLEFKSDLDMIGYEWKKIIGDVEAGDYYYETKLNDTYIIRDNNLFYYKLRFINFYDPVTGEQGFPTFEFQKL